jgi:hypothetical protein
LENIKGVKKMNKLDELTWKYFWKQKLKEVLTFVGIIFLIFFIPMIILSMTYAISPKYVTNIASSFVDIEFNLSTLRFLEMYGVGIILSFIDIVFVFMIYVFCSIIKEWLEDNWEKARERANKEVKNGKL